MYPRNPQMEVFCSTSSLQTSGVDYGGHSGEHPDPGGDIGDLGWIRNTISEYVVVGLGE